MKPLRDLALGEVIHFYDDAMLTWGDVDDFRYLLPRLMELLAVGWCPLVGDEDVEWDPFVTDPALGLFQAGKWWSWPPAERFAVERYLSTLWGAYLTRKWDAWDVVTHGSGLHLELLVGILMVDRDPTPLLDFWLEAAPDAIRDLGWFVGRDRTAAATGTGRVAQGGPITTSRAIVAAWIAGPTVMNALEAAARDPRCAAYAWELVRGMDALQREGRSGITFARGTWRADERARGLAARLGVSLGLPAT